MINRLTDKTFVKQNAPIQNNQWEATVFLSDDANVLKKKKCIKAAALLGQCGTKEVITLNYKSESRELFLLCNWDTSDTWNKKKKTMKMKDMSKKRGSVKKELPVNVLLSNLFEALIH